MRHFQEVEPEFFQVRRMPHSSQGKTVVDLVEFGRPLADGHQHDPCLIGQRNDRAALLELFVQILAAITNRLYPLIRFFVHGSLQTMKMACLTFRQVERRWPQSYASGPLRASW